MIDDTAQLEGPIGLTHVPAAGPGAAPTMVLPRKVVPPENVTAAVPVADSPTVALQPAVAPALEQPAEDAPIFVDTSGRRHRKVRWLGWLLAVPAAGYLALLVSSLLGGPTVDAPFLPQGPAQSSTPPPAPTQEAAPQSSPLPPGTPAASHAPAAASTNHPAAATTFHHGAPAGSATPHPAPTTAPAPPPAGAPSTPAGTPTGKPSHHKG